MKVLHVVQSLDPAWGGMARVVPELAAGLKSLGVDGRIATLAGGRYGRPPADLGVEVLTFSAPDGSALGRSGEFNRAIGRLLDETDVLHLHGLWTGQNWSAARAARRRGVPYLMTPHSMMMPWAWRRSWWKKRPVGWLFEYGNLRRAARLHALAPGEAEHIRRLGFNERIETIANGIWPEQFEHPPPADELIRAHPHLEHKRWLLFLSRIHVQKGIVPLLQACFDLAHAGEEWHVVVAGPDTDGLQRVLTAAVTRKGQSSRITFLGMLDRRQVLAALGRASIFAQPSLSEGLSVSILEAMAAGLPVVISPQCNLPEVAAMDAGRVVPPARRAIGPALRELLAMTPSELSAMGHRARQIIRERFSWPRLLPQYARLYESVLAESPRAARR